MLKQEDHEKLTHTGPSTPLGGLLRSYWQPAGLVSEMPAEKPVKATRLMGEDLVLFKRGDGWGLIDRFCAHRGVDLSYGRLEEGGLRCLYHGWLYNSEGRCVEQPAEPEHSQFINKVRIANYPCVEKNGIIFTYMGPGDPPPFPNYDCFAAPDEYTFAFKGLWECNWLQGLEGGIDPSHVSFLHRFVDEDPREAYGQQFAEEVAGTGQKLSKLVGDHYRPDIEVESADHGLRVFAIRQLTEELKHVRVTNLMFPNAFTVPFGNTKVFTQWHVPIDDHHHYWYMIHYDFNEHIDKDEMLRQRLEGVTLPEYRPVRNRSNNWGFDPKEQSELTYTGMGLDINVHDQWAVESMGAVQDRTQERLGISDRAVSANRRLLLRSIRAFEAGNPLPSRPLDETRAQEFIGPIAFDTIAKTETWSEEWQNREDERRQNSPWARTSTEEETPVG